MTEPGPAAPGPAAGGFGLGDLLGLFGGSNPLAGVGRAVSQVQQTVEHVNTTMAQLAELTARMNRLLDDIEPKLRALMPALATAPANLAAMVELVGDLGRRVQPLTQMAESAGGLFGGRGLGGLLGAMSAPANPAEPPATEPATTDKARKRSPAKPPARPPTAS